MIANILIGCVIAYLIVATYLNLSNELFNIKIILERIDKRFQDGIHILRQILEQLRKK